MLGKVNGCEVFVFVNRRFKEVVGLFRAVPELFHSPGGVAAELAGVRHYPAIICILGLYVLLYLVQATEGV